MGFDPQKDDFTKGGTSRSTNDDDANQPSGNKTGLRYKFSNL